jgi:hypothetical protein
VPIRSIVLAVAVLIALFSCKEESEEAIIRKAITEAAAAAEKKDLSGVMEVVSKKVRSRKMDYKELKRFIFAQLRIGSWRKVFLVRTNVELKDERHAEVETTAILASGEKITKLEEAIPRNSGAYKITLQMEKESDDVWRAVQAEYERVKDIKALVGAE